MPQNGKPTNVAVTDRAEFMATVQVAPETESHPLQPVCSNPGLAVSVTTVSMAYGSEQSLPQLMPCGLEATVPSPLARPDLLTVSTTGCGGWRTVSTVLALAPDWSVAVIVVVPAPVPVASPAESIVATAVLLLVHRTPAPLIATGLVDPVVVPLPN